MPENMTVEDLNMLTELIQKAGGVAQLQEYLEDLDLDELEDEQETPANEQDQYPRLAS